MKIKRFAAAIITAVLLICLLSGGTGASALLFVETQYTYSSANMSWLKDIIIKEDMSSVNGLSKRSEIQAVAAYPYTETAESFSEEVAYYQILYTLDEDMANVMYLYMLEIAESFADSSANSDYSDDFIRSYLESLGIVYPAGEAADSTETLVVARALFSVITSDEDFTVKRGTGLYDAFTSYTSTLFGVNTSALLKFDGDNDFADLKEYVTAACKLMLFNAGYDVSAASTDEEIYRLIAVMTIKSQGISIDSSTATLEEIKLKYLCAMMCKIYGVSIDLPSFEKAANDYKLDFYMLKLIGKENGVAIKDTVSYKEAFDLVCKNSDYFNIEAGEFYADIYEYNVKLNYKRSTVWIYAQTLGTTNESNGTAVSVKIDGKSIRGNYYADVTLDKNKPNQSVIITVEYKDESGTKSSSYKINFIQGAEEYVKDMSISSSLSSVSDTVTKLLGEVGLDSSFATIVRNIPFELPDRIFNISSLLLPEFDSNSLGSSLFLQKLFGYSANNSTNTDTEQLGGIGGLDTFNSQASNNSVQSMDFNINVNNLNNSTVEVPLITEKPASSANQLVIENPNSNTPSVSDDSDWVTEFISDTPTIIVLIIVLIATFTVCLILFLKLLKQKDASAKGKNKTGKK